MKTDVKAVFAPAKKAAIDDEKAIGADMAGNQRFSQRPRLRNGSHSHAARAKSEGRV
jgi:hypothetical protein